MRGKQFHNYLVEQSAIALRNAGFAVELECPRTLPDGRLDFFDILATRTPITLACEIETTPRKVMVNVEKAFALALPLWIIVPDRRTRMAVDKKVAQHCKRLKRHRIWILLPDELPQALTICFSKFSFGLSG